MAPDFEMTRKPVRSRPGPLQHAVEAVGVAVVQDQKPLALRAGGGEGLAAEAGAAGAEHDEAAVAPAPVASQRLQRGEIVARVGTGEEAMRSGRACLTQPLERGRRLIQQFLE